MTCATGSTWSPGNFRCSGSVWLNRPTGTATVENDPDFDLDFHIRRMAAPDPGNLTGVLEMARVAGMEDFDRARPLWTVTLIDDLDDGGAAVLCEFHHSLTDGVGGVQIGMTLFDLLELPSEHEPMPAPPKVPRPPWLSGYRDVLGYDAGLVATAMAGAITSAPKLSTRASDTRWRPSNPPRPLRLRSPNCTTREPNGVPSDEGADPDPPPWRV